MMRFRTRGARRSTLVGLLLVVALAATACVPSDGSPGSPGVPVQGQSTLSAAELVNWFVANDPPSLPYRATGATIQQLAQMFVDEGNRYNVRGDIAFAQSVVETAYFNFPDYGQVRTYNNNFAGIGACDSCGNGFQFSTALAGVRAQMQLLRNYADAASRVTNIPDAPIPELWGSNPATASYNFDHYFAKGWAPLWNNMGNGNWATAPDYATVVLRVYNQMLTFNGRAGQCPPDGLKFGALTGLGPCPVSLRQPGRSIAANGAGGYYVLNGDGHVTAYNGAPDVGSPPIANSDLYRDIALMPNGDGYVALTSIGVVFKVGSAADPANLGSVGFPYTPSEDRYRSIAITPDGKGYVILDAFGNVTKWGSAATGPLASLGNPSWSEDLGRSIALMPDGAGYLVLDSLGGVNKYGSATTGVIGTSSTRYWGVDLGRDITVLSVFGAPLGYYVLDAWGGVLNTPGLAAVTNSSAVVFADRWRGMTIYGGKPLLVRNDGSRAFTK